MDVITYQRPTERYTVRRNIAIAILVNLERADVQSGICIPSNVVVINDRVFPSDDFRYGIGEVGRVAQTDVNLSNRCLSAGLDND